MHNTRSRICLGKCDLRDNSVKSLHFPHRVPDDHSMSSHRPSPVSRIRLGIGATAVAATAIATWGANATALSLPGFGKPGATATATPFTNGPVGFTRKAVGSLHVVGNKILDASNSAMVLGGVHRTGYESATGDNMGPAEADSLATWASMVRIPVAGSLISSTCNNGGAAWLARLDNIVSQVTSRNMIALIDYHSSAISGCGTPQHIPLPQRAEARSFWQQISVRYANNPLVAFELYNEPHANSTAQWVSGGAIVGSVLQGNYIGAGMQELYDIVKGNTTNNLIFVEGNGFGGDETSVMSGALHTVRARTVFAMHTYTCPRNKDLSCINDPKKRSFPTAPGTVGARWAPVSQVYPVVNTETGFPHPTGAVPPPGGQWFQSIADWAINTSIHGGSQVGVIGFSDDGSWGGSDWALLDPAANWAPNSSGAPLVNYMKTVQPAN